MGTSAPDFHNQPIGLPGIGRRKVGELNKRLNSLRWASNQLIRVQDEERRRIARELHDSVGQCLAALKINLELLNRPQNSMSKEKTDRVLAEALSLADQCLNETRTISHLLHPPLLDRIGLPSALRCYVDGFVERSGIKVDLRLPSDLDRMPPDLETTLFRIVQESLTNIHRHSGSLTAEIHLTRDAQSVTLQVSDQGVGIPPEKLVDFGSRMIGVGVAGMRERVSQFGGHLELSSGRRGTTVRAEIPLGDTP